MDLTKFINGCHVNLLLGFAPISKPRYLNGVLPSLKFKTFEASSNKRYAMFIPTKRLLWKLTFINDINSNNKRFSFMI